MTAAFEEFMRQHDMTGSETADGYSPDVFIGLEDRERECVFKLLTDELPWSADWLFRLDAERALTVAKEKEKELRGRSYGSAYMLQKVMTKYSGDLLYQKHMIEDYACYDVRLKARVIDAIDCTPTNAETISFFKEVILTEVDTDAVASASIYFLDAMKIPAANDAEKRIYNRLLDELRSEDVRIKLRAISETEKFRDDLLRKA